jgi:hypothetical protein
LKVNHAFLVSWIVLSLPAAALFQIQLFVLAALTIIGLAGMLLKIPTASAAVSVSLLGLIVWGKIASDILSLPAEDSAVLLLQFIIVIFLMEASNAALTFDAAYSRLAGKDDEISIAARARLIRWVSAQLANLGKFAIATFGLSIGLLLVGGIFNVSFNQLAFSGILVLAAVVALLILLTYRREPEGRTSTK